MAVMDDTRAPVLAAPRPPQERMSLWQFLRTVRDSSIATFPAEAYEKDIASSTSRRRSSMFCSTMPAITSGRISRGGCSSPGSAADC